MIEKDVRALLPAWTACALAILASRWESGPFRYLGVPAYLIGSAGLGAWVMGHEYAHGTVASLLTLPVPRRRVWAVKLATAAPMLAALAVLGQLFVPLGHSDLKLGAAMFVLPPVVALFVTPWLTMVTRSPLAGAVFTFAALGGSLAASEWIGVWLYGFTDAVDAFRVTFMWWALGGLSAAGAVLGWRTFARLEVHDGHDADVQLPVALRQTRAGTAVTRRHPLRRVIVKELRIQQLAIVVAALWALAYIITEVSGVQRMAPKTDVTIILVLTTFYSLVLPVVIGSLACAEERHLGTLDGQLLLPMRSSTQWIMKSAIALGLAVLLAVILPLVLADAFGNRLLLSGPRNNVAPTLIIVFVATGISLYVSTLARSGLRALMSSIAALFAFGFLVTKVLELGLGTKVFYMVQTVRGHTHYGPMMGPIFFIGPVAAFAIAILSVALALPSFRYAVRRPAIIALHGAIVIGCVLGYDIMMNVMMALR